MKIIANKFQGEDADALDFQFIASPNVNPSVQRPERTLIIHSTEGPSVQAAVGIFSIPLHKKDSRSGLSIHLILGKDGRQVIQMVSLERGANHAAEFNSRSIGIELDYPGDLRESGSKYKLRSEYREDQYIQASSLNSPHFKYWPLYPRQQLDALVEISKALINHYQIVDVAGHEELHSYKLDPGPAFPIVQFRARLGVKGRSIVLQETARDVRVRNKPGDGFLFLPEPIIPAGTPVTIINEFNDERGLAYCLISVIETVLGNPWILGWVLKEEVRVRVNQDFIVRDDHFLGTPQGSRFQVIKPHTNGFDQRRTILEHKYIVMHFTTGTRIESTIAHFRNINSGVSAHLLIARDGRVIQFLPFNAISFHAGFSWWERDSSLNRYSIGIELDNAGILKQSGAGWMRKGIPIADADVQVLTHRRESKPRGWHTFTEIQLDVAEKIVRALAEHYGGTQKIELLGHDDVNLANRLDPGPAFPMEDIRERVFGRREARIRIFTMNRTASLYTNFEGHLPNVRQRLHDSRLPKGAEVKVRRQAGKWSLVVVVRSRIGKGIGWILSSTLIVKGKKGSRQGKKGGKKKAEVRMTTIAPQDFYRKAESPPTPKLRLPKFDHDPRIRIEEVRGSWSLVVLLDFLGREGWVETRFITPDPLQDAE
ncbi:MAG TPA: N-acetylmuramoyl-L-alanine amidase [Anaerolineales bacterium]|nr:N-acetylmuramoyl-L-alanine amidase [Anaerolineales bacterium]